MKHSAFLFILVLALLLTACGPSGPFGTRETDHIPETTEDVGVNGNEITDMGIGSVHIVAPDRLTATVDAPDVTFTAVFTGVNPGGAPEGGRVCTLKLYQNGEEISSVDDFHLTDGARQEFTVPFEFKRYQSQEDAHLLLELDYKDEYCYKEIDVSLADYPDEYYAMASGDPYPYAITILVNKNVAIVYGKDETGEYTHPVKTFICSTGVNTPQRGTYKLLHKYEWKELIHDLWGQYATWVTGDILIHSLPYNAPEKDAMWSWQFNRLGGAVSTGCIRMRCCDCKWIFDYCPCGTPVTFEIVREMPEGITYPTYEKLDLDSPDAGWDPTDPDPNNPWHPELPDTSWSALIPYYDELHEAYTTLDWKQYADFAKSFAPFVPEE